MTIAKGESWGRTVQRPTDLRLVDNDASLAAALTDGTGKPTGVAAGDLHRTVGARDVARASTVLELPVDLLQVTTASVRATAAAHVQVHSPWWRGGWWRGPVLMVMNAEFIGDWQVVSRGHPNDGRAELCTWGSEFGVRQRIQARRRLRNGSHVPHPQIDTATFRRRDWRFDAPMEIVVDGRRVGRSSTLEVVVLADAATLYA